MSFFDWVELFGFRNEHYKGSCSITLGDVLGGTIGSVHSNIFGAETKIVCDLEDLFCDHVLGETGTLGKLIGTSVAGIGGAATWVYGGNLGATYFGPKIDILRAEAATKTAPDLNTSTAKEGGTLDAQTAIAVKALSAAMCLVALGFDIAIYCVHQQKDSEETVEFLKICCYTLIGRLMALLKDLEVKGTWAEFAEEWVKTGKAIAQQWEKALKSKPTSPDLSMGLVEVEMIEMKEVVTFAKDVL